jgi:erythromycin esterase
LSDKEAEWLKKQIIPLKGFDPDVKSDDDLIILSKLIGDAKVVALGEVTHGSSEIFKMKHRIIKYLAEKENFDIFSIEANMPESYRINEYTVEGKGNPVDLIKGMYFWTWRTEEVLGMVEWMRKFNGSIPRIKFTGFDMQYFTGAVKELEKSFARDSIKLKEISELSVILDSVQSKSKGKNIIVIDKSQSKAINQKLADIKDYISKTGFEKGESEWLKQNIRIIEQYLSGTRNRDKYMADNLLWIKDQNPGSKIVAWAHNYHVSKGNHCMGHYLSESLKKDYLSIGFAFYKGCYTARGEKGLTTYTAQEAFPGTYEYCFNSIDVPIFILDLRKVKEQKSEEGKWLRENMCFRSVGAVKMKNELFSTSLINKYDIIIFIKESTNSVLLK